MLYVESVYGRTQFSDINNRCFDVLDRLKDNFLLFVDPTMKAMYQVDLTLTGSGPQQIRGIDLRTSNVPARVAYDYSSLDLYWHDNEFSGQNSIKRMKITGDASEHSLTILSRGTIR